MADDVEVPEAVAYEVQSVLTAQRLATGERIIGWKLGYTTAAMRRALGVDRPNHGPLTDAMALRHPAVTTARLVQPRVEPEIAVRLGPDGTIVSRHLALEVVDSVWEGYRFTWAHNTADGSSAALAVVTDTPLPDVLEGMEVDMRTSAGEHVRATMGSDAPDPGASVAWLLDELSDSGAPIPDGALVLTGGLIPPLALPPGGWAEARLMGSTARIDWRMDT